MILSASASMIPGSAANWSFVGDNSDALAERQDEKAPCR